MSRIGRMPISLPKGVQVKIEDSAEGATVGLRGPKGELKRTFHPVVAIGQEDGTLVVNLREGQEKEKALHGLSRALLNNMVTGVAQGFRKSLEIQGAGYRAQSGPDGVTLMVGFTHPVIIPAPKGVSIIVEQNTRIHIDGADKESVGQTAALVRAVRPPEVYTGKGIRYIDEQVRRKAGKATGRKK